METKARLGVGGTFLIFFFFTLRTSEFTSLKLAAYAKIWAANYRSVLINGSAINSIAEETKLLR